MRDISEKCLQVGINIDDVRIDAIDPLHRKIVDYDVSLHRKVGREALENERESLQTRISIAERAVHQSIEKPGIATGEEVKPIYAVLNTLTEQIKKGAIEQALDLVEGLSNDLFILALKKVVTCECPQK